MTLKDFLKLSAEEKEKLEKLSLSALFDANDTNFQIFGNALMQCFNLIEIDLSSNKLVQLEHNDITCLGIALGRCTNLRKLDLSNNEIFKDNIKAFECLCIELTQCKELSYLNIGNNKLSDLKVENLEALGKIFELFPKLQELDISNVNLGNCGEQQLQALGHSIAKINELKVLNCSNNNLGNIYGDGIQAFCYMLVQCKNLEKLQIEWNNFGQLSSGRIKCLFYGITQCKQLKEVSFRYNVFHKAQTIKEEICLRSKFDQLRHLDFRNNELSVTSCDWLKTSKTYNELCVSTEAVFEAYFLDRNRAAIYASSTSSDMVGMSDKTKSVLERRKKKKEHPKTIGKLPWEILVLVVMGFIPEYGITKEDFEEGKPYIPRPLKLTI